MPWSQHSDPNAESHADAQTLQAYAAHERTPDDATLRHIARCPQCMADLASLRSQLPASPARESRAHCPPVEAIQAYALGQLKGVQKRNVEAHLEECLRCAAEVAASREFLPAELAPAARPSAALEGLRRVIASLLLPEPSEQLALRGEGTDLADEAATGMQTFRAEEIEISLQSTIERGQVLVTGILSADDPTRTMVPIAARLVRGSGSAGAIEPMVVAEAPIELGAAFELGPVPTGQYRLEILFDDRLIEIASLDLSAP